MSAETNLVLRAAQVSEARLIASISRLQVEHGLRWRWTPARVRRHIRDPDTMVLVATLAGELTGFAIMKFGDRQAHLYLLAVLPRHHRRGFGSRMLEWLEKSCETAAIERIRLEVRADNRPAMAFYRQLGYRYLGLMAGYYDRRETAVIMGKSLLQEVQS